MIDKLAKLLATENIIVEHRNSPTASFDTGNRILTLPMWKDITPTLETLLVGHEVGHALYTPNSGWSSLENKKKIICNVVEDARIERKMKIKYPGLRRDFYEGYKELSHKDFFKIKDKKIETMNFLDRLNLHFKIGAFQSIPFEEDEKCFVDDVENAKTWDEIVDITNRIFNFLKTKKDNIDSSQENKLKYYDEEDSDEEDSDEEDSDEEDSDEEDSDEEDSNQEDSDQEDQFSCDTQTAMDDSIAEQLIDDKSKPFFYVNIRDLEYKDKTISYTTLLQMFGDEKTKYINGRLQFQTHMTNIEKDEFRKDCDSKIAKENKISWNKFLNVNSKVVTYLIKEFEMKKAADHYIKQRESKTGVINSNKLHAYTIIDDIFKKTTILPESKNHGLVLFVDFSGSMSDNIYGTIEQLLCLTLFCRRVNIPHRVYAFTDQNISEEYLPSPIIEIPYAQGDIVVGKSDRLLELFTEKMRNNQFSEMGEWLLNFAERNSRNYRNSNKWFSECIRLNSTPLNSALIYARKIIADFKKQTNAQIVNCVVLTDGESNSNKCISVDGSGLFAYGPTYKLIVRDIQTKQEILIKKPSLRDFPDRKTDIFVEFLRKRCDINVICYRIENSNSSIRKTINKAYYEKIQIAEINYKKMRKEKYFNIKGYMKFDDYFLIYGKQDINTQDSLLDGEVYENKNSLSKAFIKANIRRGVSRVLLSKFIEKIAA